MFITHLEGEHREIEVKEEGGAIGFHFAGRLAPGVIYMDPRVAVDLIVKLAEGAHDSIESLRDRLCALRDHEGHQADQLDEAVESFHSLQSAIEDAISHLEGTASATVERRRDAEKAKAASLNGAGFSVRFGDVEVKL